MPREGRGVGGVGSVGGVGGVGRVGGVGGEGGVREYCCSYYTLRQTERDCRSCQPIINAPPFDVYGSKRGRCKTQLSTSPATSILSHFYCF